MQAPYEGPCWPVAWVYEFAYCLRRGYYAWVEGPGEPVALSSGEGTWMAADGWCGPVQFIRDGHGSPVPVIRLAHVAESDTAERPEHLMLAALARLIEAETGQSVARGIVQYGPTGRQEVVTLDERLRAAWQRLDAEIRAVIHEGRLPAPRADQRCPACPRLEVCNPSGAAETAAQLNVLPPVRQARTLYVDEIGAVVRRDGRQLVVTVSRNGTRRELLRLPALLVDQVVLVGPVQITSQALRLLLRQNVDIVYLSTEGRFEGRLATEFHPHVALRLAQYEAARDPQRALPLARQFVRGKLQNMARLLRHYAQDYRNSTLEATAAAIESDLQHLSELKSPDAVRGLEGAATRRYFSVFNEMLRPEAHEPIDWPVFPGRNRRPPTDPVNATLGYLYALLLGNLVTACAVAGLDPYVGYLHTPAYGRPSLALDLMEEFRAPIADRLTLHLFNRGKLRPRHFEERSGGVYLNEEGRAVVLAAWQEWRQQVSRHPVLGLEMSQMRHFEAQARLLARTLQEPGAEYTPFVA
ncbi:CRISPR-associated exonuclease Cas4/endonuclease Cas1 fusion [Rhodothermus marinus]|nr:CRISPR-associated exonuclease Cas4/endonuclease Cas1 fusion [Rhodothermus marinus]BBM72611.1 CRISPR-associated exonuclease Cas4/endonuclease Cas1 fusion [Rhodothermus marinus]